MKIMKIKIITLLCLFAVASAQFFNMAGLLFPDARGDTYSTVDPLDIDDIIEVHDSPYNDISPKEEHPSYALNYQLGLGGNTTT